MVNRGSNGKAVPPVQTGKENSCFYATP